MHFFKFRILFKLMFYLCTGIERKKGEEDGNYIPVNVRMQRTQVENLYCFYATRS